MKNDLNKKEKQFKELAENLDFNLDTDGLWSDLSEELDKKKRKRIGFLPFSLGLLILSFGVSVFFMNSEGRIANSNEHTEVTPNKQTIKKAISENYSTIINDSEASNTELQKQIARVVTPQNTSRPNTITNNETKIKTYDLPTTNDTRNVPIETILTSPENTVLMASQNIDPIKNKSYNNTANIVTKKEAKQKQLATLDQLHTLPFTNRLHLLKPLTLKSRILNSISPVRTNNWKYFSAMHIGLNQNHSTNATLNPEELDASILTLEDDKLGFNSEIRLGTEHRAGWRFTIGLAYSSFFSAIDSERVNIDQSSVPGTEKIIIHPDGSQTLVAGSLEQSTTTTTSFLWHRRHQRLQTQVHVGKTIATWDKLSLGLDAGLQYNLWASDKGYYFDENYTFTKLEVPTDSPYISNHGLGISSALRIEYQFGQYGIGVHPFVVYNPKSIIKDSHIYSSKNHQVGLNASFFYFLDK